jgi:hypothetical protein
MRFRNIRRLRAALAAAALLAVFAVSLPVQAQQIPSTVICNNQTLPNASDSDLNECLQILNNTIATVSMELEACQQTPGSCTPERIQQLRGQLATFQRYVTQVEQERIRRQRAKEQTRQKIEGIAGFFMNLFSMFRRF